MQRIKKGDTVEVIAGKDNGLRGEVLRVINKDSRVVVEKVNIVKKHQKPKQQTARAGQQPGIIEMEAPIDLSNVMLVCPSCGKASRIGFRLNTEEKKVRWCKQCEQDID